MENDRKKLYNGRKKTNFLSFREDIWLIRNPLLPLLADVPVFMPVTFEVNPGDACLVVFADIDIDAFLETGEASVPRSARRHALSDGFAFVGFRTGGASV